MEGSAMMGLARFLLPSEARVAHHDDMPNPEPAVQISSQLAKHLLRCRALAGGAPPGWPFEPLGLSEDFIILRDAAGLTAGVPVTSLSRLRILGLFDGQAAMLRREFPSVNGRGWDPHNAAEAIISAASARGQVDPADVGLVPIYRQPRRGGSRRVSLVPSRQLSPSRTA